MNSCPGFFYGKNTDLLPLYDKYKRNDSVNNHSISSAIMESGVFILSTVLVSQLITENLYILTKTHVKNVLIFHQLKRFVLELDI